MPPKPARTSMPRVVGVVHDSTVHLSSSENRSMLVEERQRVLRALDRMNAGDRVGIELTPLHLEELYAGRQLDLWPGDILVFAANQARRRNLQLVSLDTNARHKKHDEIFSSLRSLQKLRKTHLWNEKYENQFRQKARNHVIHAYTRSLQMGLKLKREKLALSFIGAGHANQLFHPLLRTHAVELPSTRYWKKIIRKENELFDSFLSGPQNYGFKQKLYSMLARGLLENKKS